MISFTKAFKKLIAAGLVCFLCAFGGLGIAYYLNQYLGKLIAGIGIITGIFVVILGLLLVLFGKHLDFIVYDKEGLDKEIKSAFQKKN